MPWTPSEIPDMSGKTVAVTGATSGVGLHAAKALAHRGAQVVMLCRNVDKMAAVAAQFAAEKPCDIVQLQCDLTDLESVRSCADAFAAAGITKLDVLLLNAGLITPGMETSPQGVEHTFATNHLGHWLLCGLLLPYIQHVPDSRIIAVSSLAHRSAKEIDYELVRGKPKEDYKLMNAYSYSKLANLLMIEGLNKRLSAAGAKTIAVGTHPGFSVTDITSPLPRSLYLRFVFFISAPARQTAEQGSWPLVMAATDKDIKVGCYYAPQNWFETSGPPISNGIIDEAVRDQAKVEKLWTVSEELTGFTYSI